MSLRQILFQKKNLHGGSWLIVERAVVILKGFLLSLLFANLLTKETFGAYQLILAIVGTVAVSALPGMGTAMIQAIARKKEGTFFVGVKEIAKYSLFGSLFLVLTAVAYFFLNESEIAWILLCVASIFPFYITATGAWRVYYIGKEDFSTAAKVGIIGELITLLFLAPAIYFFHTLGPILFAVLIIPTLYYGYFLKRNLLETREGSFDSTNITFGKKLSVLYGVGVAVSYIDKIIIAHSLGLAQVAVFSIALIIPEQIRDSIRVLVSYVLPGFSRMEDTRHNRIIILKGIFWLFLIVSFLVAVYFLISPILFRLLFPNYTEAIQYTQLAALTSLTVPFMILDSYFRSIKDDKTAIKGALSGYISGTVANVVLIPLYGIWGAIAARAISLGTNAVFFLIIFLRKNVL